MEAATGRAELAVAMPVRWATLAGTAAGRPVAVAGTAEEGLCQHNGCPTAWRTLLRLRSRKAEGRYNHSLCGAGEMA